MTPDEIKAAAPDAWLDQILTRLGELDPPIAEGRAAADRYIGDMLQAQRAGMAEAANRAAQQYSAARAEIAPLVREARDLIADGLDAIALEMPLAEAAREAVRFQQAHLAEMTLPEAEAEIVALEAMSRTETDTDKLGAVWLRAETAMDVVAAVRRRIAELEMELGEHDLYIAALANARAVLEGATVYRPDPANVDLHLAAMAAA